MVLIITEAELESRFLLFYDGGRYQNSGHESELLLRRSWGN